MPKICKLCIALAMILLPDTAKAEPSLTLKVVAFHIPHVIEEYGEGLYNQILEQVTKKTGIKFELDVLPIARARMLYNAGKYECLLPLDPMTEGQYFKHNQSSACRNP